MNENKTLQITINLEEQDFNLETSFQGNEIDEKDKNYLMIALHMLKENILKSNLDELNKRFKND